MHIVQFDNDFVCDTIILSVFRILIPRTTKYDVISETSLVSSAKNLSILYLSSLATNLLIFFLDLYVNVICLFRSDTLQALMFVCLSVSEFCFMDVVILVLKTLYRMHCHSVERKPF